MREREESECVCVCVYVCLLARMHACVRVTVCVRVRARASLFSLYDFFRNSLLGFQIHGMVRKDVKVEKSIS